jgi:hypothetical protein
MKAQNIMVEAITIVAMLSGLFGSAIALAKVVKLRSMLKDTGNYLGALLLDGLLATLSLLFVIVMLSVNSRLFFHTRLPEPAVMLLALAYSVVIWLGVYRIDRWWKKGR